MNPFKLLQEAARAVPAVKYALGVAGVIAVVAVVGAFGLSPQAAVFGGVVTLVLMVALVVFAKLTTTAPKHFLFPVLILMWSFLGLTIATGALLFSSVFFRWPTDIRYLIPGDSGVPVSSTEAVDGVVKAASLQREAGDYAGAWTTIQTAVAKNPKSRAAQQEQLQIAMAWLRHASVTRPQTFADLVDRLGPVLYQGLVGAKAQEAADIHAHIGWGNFLKYREGARGLEIEGQYQRALEIDAGNPFAHAMWGHFILTQGGGLSAAAPHFAAALASGRERAFVRSFQVGALMWQDTPETAVELIRVADAMRKNDETLSLDARARMVPRVYFGNRRRVLEQLSSILPPADHLATFRWLTEGMDDQESSIRDYVLARLTEAAGDCAQALPLYRSVASRPFVYAAEIQEGMARCEQERPADAASRDDVSALSPVPADVFRPA